MDHEAMVRRAEDVTEPFAHSGLCALFAAAAVEEPDAVLLRDDGGFVTARDAHRMIGKVAAEYRRAGLLPGERILIVAGAHVSGLVALAAALAIGAEPALAPCGLTPVELAAHARVCKAAALVGPCIYGDLDCDDSYLSTASLVDSIRILASLGPGSLDGAIDLSPQALARLPNNLSFHGQQTETPLIATFHRTAAGPELVLHRQAALFADALSLIEKARINPSKSIISTLPPSSMAGLVAGPFAALIGASDLMLHGPFEAKRFLRACDSEPGAHLVLPATVASLLVPSHVQALTSLILVSRFAGGQAFTLPEKLSVERPMVDLYAFAEETLLMRRRVDGEALPPSRVTDKSVGGGLGARLNRARADARASERG